MSEHGNPEAWQASASQAGAGASGRGPWIIAGAIVAAAIIVSFTLVSLRGIGPTLDISAPLDSARLGSTGSAEQIYLDAKTRAQDRAAQSDLRNALVAAKTIYTEGSSYIWADASPTGLSTVEPSLCYVDAYTPSIGYGFSCVEISVFASSEEWAAARMSDSGTCFWIGDDANTGTTYGSGLPCTGEAATGATESSWETG